MLAVRCGQQWAGDRDSETAGRQQCPNTNLSLRNFTGRMQHAWRPPGKIVNERSGRCIRPGPGCGLAWRVRRLFLLAPGIRFSLASRAQSLKSNEGFAGRRDRPAITDFPKNHCGPGANTISRLLRSREILAAGRADSAGRSKSPNAPRFPPERRDRRRSNEL